MNKRLVLHVVCLILRIEAVVMVPALLIAVGRQEMGAVRGFFLAIVLLLGFSALTDAMPPKKQAFSPREGFLVVSLTWVVASVFGAIPFFVSGAIPDFMDAFFETVSGFTTTGASILRDIEALPWSLLYWRSFTHWLGGMGVLVLMLAIVPVSKKSGSTIHILRAESPGPQVDKLVPRVGESAKILYAIYVGLTVLQTVLLLAGGLNLFESVTTALGTAGTGGFAVLNDSLMSYSPYLQNVVTVFMVLFGVNFNIFYLLIIRDYYKVLHSTELWVYLGLFFGSIALICFNIYPQFHSSLETFHHAAFQVASVMTTTGFATVDFNTWPQFSKMILVLLMFCGACAGSTGGGIKTARLVILAKSFRRDLVRLVRPRSVLVVRMDGHTIPEETIRSTHGYLVAYVALFILSTLLIAINNFSFETTTTSVIACLNNIGPGLDMVGPAGNYADFSTFSKGVLSADMLIGRLELFPMLMLFVPAAYKR